MARSRRNDPASGFLAWLAAAPAGLGLLGVAQGAPEACANPEIKIQADQPAEIDIRNNNAVLRNVVITQCDKRIEAREARVTGGIDFDNARWTFSGAVRIKAEGGSLSSEKAVVSFRDKLIAQAIITGEPAEFSQPREDGSMSSGHAKTIEYETARGTVSFRDDAWLSVDCNEIRGQALTYNIRAQRVEGQKNPVKQGSTKDRIVITIQPDSKPGQPCTRAAPVQKP
jgi:lipopolysaccharide export system protein LptA